MITLNIIRPEIQQSWNIIKIAQVPPVSWEKVFKDAKYELEDVSAILDEQEVLHGQYFPLKKDIFAAFDYTRLHDVKVVIIGQDPYHHNCLIESGKSFTSGCRSFI